MPGTPSRLSWSRHCTERRGAGRPSGPRSWRSGTPTASTDEAGGGQPDNGADQRVAVMSPRPSKGDETRRRADPQRITALKARRPTNQKVKRVGYDFTHLANHRPRLLRHRGVTWQTHRNRKAARDAPHAWWRRAGNAGGVAAPDGRGRAQERLRALPGQGQVGGRLRRPAGQGGQGGRPRAARHAAAQDDGLRAPTAARRSLAADRRALGVATDHTAKATVDEPQATANLTSPGLRGAQRVTVRAAAAGSAGIAPTRPSTTRG